VPREVAPPIHQRRVPPHGGAALPCGKCPCREPRRAPSSAMGHNGSATAPSHRAPPAPGGCRSGAVGRRSRVREDRAAPPATLEDPCRRPWKVEDGKEGEWKESGKRRRKEEQKRCGTGCAGPPAAEAVSVGGGGASRRQWRSPPESPCASNSGDGPTFIPHPFKIVDHFEFHSSYIYNWMYKNTMY
jgi:hypothetical protein